MTAGPEPDLLQAVDALGTTTWSGTAWRHTAPGRNPVSGEGARLFGGRWNSPDIAATVYLAWPERTCLEEFTRMAAGQGRGTASFLPRALHEIEVLNVLVVNLTSTASLDQVGLELADIQGDDRSACQLVGDAVHFLGSAGLIAPSATGSGTVMALFESRLGAGALTVVTTTTIDT